MIISVAAGADCADMRESAARRGLRARVRADYQKTGF
jgi:hypothetical protein